MFPSNAPSPDHVHTRNIIAFRDLTKNDRNCSSRRIITGIEAADDNDYAAQLQDQAFLAELLCDIELEHDNDNVDDKDLSLSKEETEDGGCTGLVLLDQKPHQDEEETKSVDTESVLRVLQQQQQHHVQEPSQTVRQAGKDSSLTSSKKSVRFTSVYIYEHPIIPGDNPTCLLGTPLTIDWNCVSAHKYDIPTLEQEEAAKKASSTTYHRRNYLEMRIPASIREKLLRQQGYTRQQLVALTRPVNIARAQRSRTLETMSLAGIQQVLQNATKGLKKVALSKQQREERQRLKQWRTPNADMLSKSSSSTFSSSSEGSSSSALTHNPGYSFFSNEQAPPSASLLSPSADSFESKHVCTISLLPKMRVASTIKSTDTVNESVTSDSAVGTLISC